jgi:type II secretory pathway predicted ATPase ExeA
VNPDSAFAPGCTRESFLETLVVNDALGRLEAGLGAREPFLLVSGEPGTGKTALAHETIARWGERVAVAYLAYPVLTGIELLEEIVLRFGAEQADGANRPRLLARLEGALAGIASRGQVAVIVVDDAHALSPELLEELRLLANAAQQAGHRLEVMLAGLPALEAVLDDPSMHAISQRISVRVKLAPLSIGETRRYIRHRVSAAGGDGAGLFSRATCLDIAALTGGVPRQINLLAAEALRLARGAGEPAVQPEHVQSAAVMLRGAVPARSGDDMDEEDAETTPAKPPSPRQRAKAPAPAPAAVTPAQSPKSAPAVRASAPAPSPAPPPPAQRPASPAPAAHTPAPASETPARIATAPDAPPPPPASQDPREWVARFVGDRGPLQIGSQSVGSGSWAARPSESLAAASSDAAQAPRARRSPPPAAPPRSRSRHGRGGRVVAVGLLSATVAIAAVVLIIRAGALARNRTGGSSVVSNPAVAPPRIERVPSLGVPAAKPAAAPPAAAPRDGGAPAPEAPAEIIRGPYTLEVGSYPDLQVALDERDRMQALTGIESWVVQPPEGSPEPNRVVVGIYRARRRADATAGMLLRSKTLPEATVIHMPPRSSRH